MVVILLDDRHVSALLESMGHSVAYRVSYRLKCPWAMHAWVSIIVAPRAQPGVSCSPLLPHLLLPLLSSGMALFIGNFPEVITKGLGVLFKRIAW